MEMEDDDDPCAASLLTYARFIRRKSTAKVTLDDINEDTLHSILSRVDVESPRELLALSVVSKRFRGALRSSTVWHTLDLKAHGAQMTNKILYGIIKDDDAGLSSPDFGTGGNPTATLPAARTDALGTLALLGAAASRRAPGQASSADLRSTGSPRTPPSSGSTPSPMRGATARAPAA